MRSRNKIKQFKAYGILLLLSLPLCLPLKAQDNDIFAKANGLYAKAKYREAISLYKQLGQSGARSAALDFNLGNACYKLDSIPAAILHYERAQQLAPGDEDIQHNLQLARLKITDKAEAEPRFFLMQWWENFIFHWPVSMLAVITVTLVLLGFCGLIYYLFAGTRLVKRISFYTGISFILLGLLSFLMAGLQNSFFQDQHQAIVFSGVVNVKSSPDNSAKTLFVLHEGTKVAVLAADQGWMKIQLPNGNSGWVAEGTVEEI